MINKLLFASLTSLVFSFFLGLLIIPLLRRFKAGQPILKYVEIHKDKSGTPTMGGLFFILSAVLSFTIFGGFSGRVATVTTCIGLAFMLVGFMDDFIKIKFRKNQGLTAMQKIIFQTGIAIVAGFFAYENGLTVLFVPFTKNSVDFGAWTIVFVAIIFLAITNSVNLTDGLDGLAGSVSTVCIIAITVLISVQIKNGEKILLTKSEYINLFTLNFCLIGGILGFLIFNTSKASVFMGDTGSLALGGFLGGISIFSSNSLFIPVIGIMFVVSSISVIMQVLRFKKSGKRFFLMAPLHHHFQLKGHSESRITFAYSLITAIMGAVVVACSL